MTLPEPTGRAATASSTPPHRAAVVAAALLLCLGLGTVTLGAGWATPGAASGPSIASQGPAAQAPEQAAQRADLLPLAAAADVAELPVSPAADYSAAPAAPAGEEPAPASYQPAGAPSGPSGPVARPAVDRSNAAAAVASTGGVALGARPTPSWARAPVASTTVAAKNGRIPIYTRPTVKRGVTIRLVNPTPQGFPLVMASVGADRSGKFLKVLLPVRPNQTYGWVRAADVLQTPNPYRIEISQSERRLLLWQGPTVIGSFPVAIGTGGTPTPNGNFFVNAHLPQAYSGAYGPHIISTSGFSEALSSFGGGEAAIGIHGTSNRASVGTSASHGCIRMFNEAITVLARTVPVGTLITIHR